MNGEAFSIHMPDVQISICELCFLSSVNAS